ncbi:hypothetical protein Agub_g13602, partial [Astrephomene gubernaculifera]
PGGKRRLQGDLEVSRAFGDLQYRPVGLSAHPDITGPWTLLPPLPVPVPVSANEEQGAPAAPTPESLLQQPLAAFPTPLLLLASDGLLEVMSPQDLCDHAAAQLSGAPHPPLTPPPPPAIALGPVGGLQAAAEGTHAEAAAVETMAAAAAGAAAAGAAPAAAAAATPTAAAAEPTAAAVAGAGPGGTSSGAGPGAGMDMEALEGVGLAGCCDCDAVAMAAAAAAAGDSEGPCAGQALSGRSSRRPALRTPASAAARLVQEAVRRGSMDNVGAVVVQLPGRVIPPLTSTAGNAPPSGVSAVVAGAEAEASSTSGVDPVAIHG